MTASIDRQIAENLNRIRERIAAAALRSGRQPEAVRLVAVTKYAGLEASGALAAAGCHELGESRPQQLWSKAAALTGLPLHWHLIGHLQRNKARRTLPLVSWIHSGDSLRLLETLDELSAEQGCRTRVLLEVNVSGEAAKHGFAPEQLERPVAELTRLQHLDVCGLMAMAGRDRAVEQARVEFARLRQLRDRLQPLCPSGVLLRELSMGMSGDFEVAIEEGATMVRIGSALLDGLPAGARQAPQGPAKK